MCQVLSPYFGLITRLLGTSKQPLSVDLSVPSVPMTNNNTRHCSYILDFESLHRGLELNKNLVTRSQLHQLQLVGVRAVGWWHGQAAAAAIIAG